MTDDLTKAIEKEIETMEDNENTKAKLESANDGASIALPKKEEKSLVTQPTSPDKKEVKPDADLDYTEHEIKTKESKRTDYKENEIEVIEEDL